MVLAFARLSIIMLVLTLLYVEIYSEFGWRYYALINQFGPVVFLLTCGLTVYSLVRMSSLTLWSPVPWFLFACAAYYGFAPLAHYYANPATLALIDADYPMDDSLLLKTNILNSAGLAIVALGTMAVTAILPKVRPRRIKFNETEIIRAMWIFLSVGVTVKYLFTLPYNLGLLSWTLPGSIQHLSQLINAAIILLFLLVHRGYGKFKPLLYSLILSELISDLMTFSNTEVILTVLAVIF